MIRPPKYERVRHSSRHLSLAKSAEARVHGFKVLQSTECAFYVTGISRCSDGSLTLSSIPNGTQWVSVRQVVRREKLSGHANAVLSLWYDEESTRRVAGTFAYRMIEYASVMTFDESGLKPV